jgi:DivIVA domain-containing protein
MELSPQSVSSTTFKIVRKGYDPDEVRAYLGELASSIEAMQNQTAAMEARARAAVARLQEIAAQAPAAPAPQPAAEPVVAPDEAETISRTLLLAQRTADQAVAEAEAKAKAIADDAESEARKAVEGAHEAAARMVEDAKADARKAGESQRIEVESAVQSLLARREFLLSDVDHLEQHIVTQRDRLRDVASQLTDIVERVPGGLGDLRRPLVSAVEGTAAAGDPAATFPAPVFADEPPELDQTAPMATFETPEEFAAADALARGDRGDETGRDDAPAPAWSNGAARDDDSTPPEGIPSQFRFDDVTSEVPSTGSSSSRDEA